MCITFFFMFVHFQVTLFKCNYQIMMANEINKIQYSTTEFHSKYVLFFSSPTKLMKNFTLKEKSFEIKSRISKSLFSKTLSITSSSLQANKGGTNVLNILRFQRSQNNEQQLIFLENVEVCPLQSNKNIWEITTEAMDCHHWFFTPTFDKQS